jgi:3-oxoacyl-[acyl-carrier-protein] synthase-3
MIGIRNIASYVPAEGIDNYAQAITFGRDSEFIDQRIGAKFLPRKDASAETSDLVVRAVTALFESSVGLGAANVDALFVVTQNPDGQGLPHCAAIAQEKLGLPNSVGALDISLGCSGFVYGLYVLAGFMTQVGLTNGILVTADPYSKILDPEDYATSLLFGDAATATWIGPDAEWTLGAVELGTEGSGALHLTNVDGSLVMNGRRVMSFAKSVVPPQIHKVLEVENLSVEQVDLFIMHQGSAGVVDAIAKQFDVPSERFPLEMQDTGNTVSSSIPLILARRLGDRRLKNVIISGFGVGFSAATALLHYDPR